MGVVHAQKSVSNEAHAKIQQQRWSPCINYHVLKGSADTYGWPVTEDMS